MARLTQNVRNRATRLLLLIAKTALFYPSADHREDVFTRLRDLDELISELETDAARYRWLRTQSHDTWSRIGFNTWEDHPSMFPIRDANIDAEMEKQVL